MNNKTNVFLSFNLIFYYRISITKSLLISLYVSYRCKPPFIIHNLSICIHVNKNKQKIIDFVYSYEKKTKLLNLSK